MPAGELPGLGLGWNRRLGASREPHVTRVHRCPTGHRSERPNVDSSYAKTTELVGVAQRVASSRRGGVDSSMSWVPWSRPRNKVDATVPALITAPTAGSKDMSASARSPVTWSVSPGRASRTRPPPGPAHPVTSRSAVAGRTRTRLFATRCPHHQTPPAVDPPRHTRPCRRTPRHRTPRQVTRNVARPGRHPATITDEKAGPVWWHHVRHRATGPRVRHRRADKPSFKTL